MSRRRHERGEHQVLAFLAGLAAIATILTFLFQFKIVAWPFDPSGTDAPGGGGHPCDSAAISLSRGSGPSGTKVVVSGNDFPSDESVELRFHTELLPPSRTGTDGRFEVSVVIPGTFDAFAPMQVMLIAQTRPSVCSATAPFQLTH